MTTVAEMAQNIAIDLTQIRERSSLCRILLGDKVYVQIGHENDRVSRENMPKDATLMELYKGGFFNDIGGTYAPEFKLLSITWLIKLAELRRNIREFSVASPGDIDVLLQMWRNMATFNREVQRGERSVAIYDVNGRINSR